ncbi:MAG: ABC transporter permease subunit [Planctomycetia bacterium]
MNPSGRPSSLVAALAIARRDLLEFVRDRRTLVITLLLPMATYPILALATALGLRTATQEIEARTAPAPIHLGLSGPEAPQFAALVQRTLATTPRSEQAGWPADVALADVSAADAESLLDRGAIDVWIITRPGLVAELRSKGTVHIPVRVSARRPASVALREQFLAFVRTLGGDVARDRVAAAGLPTTLLEPIDVVFEGDPEAGPPPLEHNVVSTLAGGVLVLLTVLTLTGAFYPAIDAIAGEKERGTIETLLIAPCRISDIVFGKFLGVLAITLATLVANVVSIAATAAVAVRYLPQGVVAALPDGALAVAVIATVLAFCGMAAVAAATCLAVTTASKSGKEAQNTLTPVILLVSAVAGSALLPGVHAGPLLAAVPFAGQVFVARSALGTGAEQPADGITVATAVAVSLLSSVAVTWLLLQLTALTLADEDVLFRGPDVAGAPLHRPARRQRPNAVQALLPLVAGFAGLWYTQGVVPADLRWAIPVQQVLAVLAPLAVVAWWQRVDMCETFALCWPETGGGVRAANLTGIVVGAILLGGGLFLLGAAVLLGVQDGATSAETRQLSSRLVALIQARPRWLAWVLIALVPAVCEELLFRGWVLSGLHGRLQLPRGAWAAVGIQAAAFALFHLLPERMPQTFVLGLVLGALVVVTRSLLPAVVCHLAHNSMPVAILALAGDVPGLAGAVEAGDSSAEMLPNWIVFAAAGAAAAGICLVAIGVRPWKRHREHLL